MLGWTVLVIAASNIAVLPSESGAAQTIRLFKWEFLRIIAPAALAVVGPIGFIDYREQLFPRWFTWGTITFAVVLAISLTGLIPQGLLSMVFFLWVGIAGVVLYMYPPESST